MMAGRMRDRVTFKTNVVEADGSGGQISTWVEISPPVWAQYMPNRGKEVSEGDRTQAVGDGILKVRYSSIMATVTEADIVVINDVEFQIRSIENPDRRKRVLEMIVQRGVVK